MRFCCFLPFRGDGAALTLRRRTVAVLATHDAATRTPLDIHPRVLATMRRPQHILDIGCVRLLGYLILVTLLATPPTQTRRAQTVHDATTRAPLERHRRHVTTL